MGQRHHEEMWGGLQLLWGGDEEFLTSREVESDSVGAEIWQWVLHHLVMVSHPAVCHHHITSIHILYSGMTVGAERVMGSSHGCSVVGVARERTFPAPQVDSLLVPSLYPMGEYL